MQHSNTSLDDVCAVIGFSATIRLIEWRGNRNIYIPRRPPPDHPLVRLLGEPAMRALSQEFGHQMIWIPSDVLHKHRGSTERKKAVAKLLSEGGTLRSVSHAMGLSERQVRRIRKELVDYGLVPSLGAEGGLALPGRA